MYSFTMTLVIVTSSPRKRGDAFSEALRDFVQTDVFERNADRDSGEEYTSLYLDVWASEIPQITAIIGVFDRAARLATPISEPGGVVPSAFVSCDDPAPKLMFFLQEKDNLVSANWGDDILRPFGVIENGDDNVVWKA